MLGLIIFIILHPLKHVAGWLTTDHIMYQVSTCSSSSKANNNSGNQTKTISYIKLPFKKQNTCTLHRESLSIFLRGTCGGHGDSSLTSGSGIWENTEDKHWDSSTAPQPHGRSWGGHTGWSPNILCPSFSLQPPCPLSPSSPASSSFSLSACLHWRRIQDRTTMALGD